MAIHRPCARTAVIVLVVANAALPAGGVIIDVGFGSGCEAGNLSDALALAAVTPGADEIRLEGDVTYDLNEPLHLTNWNASAKGALTLAGGFSDCTDTTPDDAQPTGLQYTQTAAPVMTVDAIGSGGSFVTLRRIEITHLENARVVVVAAQGTLNLQRTSILGFPTLDENAGGISVSGGSTLTTDSFSVIAANGNASTEGGGVRCVGADSLVHLAGVVQANAGSNGGGIYVAQGCELVLAGSATVWLNEATLGGGIAVGDGGIIGATAGASVSNNTASSSGGGLYAEGSSTQVELLGASISNNSAGFGGGGLYVTSSATVRLDGSGACAGGITCPAHLSGNVLAPGGRHGAAAYVVNGATLTLHQTAVRGNAIDPAEPYGSILYAVAGGELRTESAEVSGNLDADAVFQAESGGLVQVAFTTVARNWYQDPPPFLVDALGVRATGSGSSVRINSSIFHPTAGFAVSDGAAWQQIDCLLTETTSGLAAGSFVVIADPLYRNFGAGDLRLRSDSPAVDFCDAVLFAPTQGDLDGRARNHDLPTNLNGSPGVIGGRQDVGAYELWELFYDGFETGDTTRWSATVP